MKRLTVLFALVPSVAFAAPGLLAVHPLVATDAEGADAAELARHFEKLVARVPGPRAEARKVALFLEGQPGKHCTADGAECFSGLAQAAGASRILFVSVRLYPVVVSGRLVGADGRPLVEAPLKQVEKPGGKLLDVAKQALAEVVHALPLDDSSDTLVPLVKDTANPQDAIAPKPAPEEGTSSRRTVGLVAAGAGVVALAGGVVFHLNAADTGRRFDAAAAGTHSSDLPLLRSLQSQAAGQQVAGSVLLGVGAAALAAGGYLALTGGGGAPGPAAPSAALVVLPGGVALAGRFP